MKYASKYGQTGLCTLKAVHFYARIPKAGGGFMTVARCELHRMSFSNGIFAVSKKDYILMVVHEE